jgi:tyrosine-protein kinase Etk/Wzc
MKNDEKADFWIILEVLFKWWRIIAFNIFTITLIAVVVSLVIPKKWTATSVILPPTASTGSLNVEDIGSAYTLSSMALSALPGIISPSDIIAGVLQSETLMKTIIDRFDIMTRYKIKRLDSAFRKMKRIMNIRVTKEQMIVIEATTEDPELSANIANAYVEEIDKFNKEALMTTGKQFRIFLERRLKEAEDELTAAAESLRNFQQEHKVFSLEEETKKSIEILAVLQAEIIAKKVQLNALRSYSYSGNPQISILQKDISALEKQLREMEYGKKKGKKETEEKDFGIGFSVPLDEVPDVGLKLTRLEMNLRVKRSVYSLIAEQYEKARILESKDTPTITVLDSARKPDLRSSPKRKKLVILMFVLSTIYSFGLAIVCETVERFREKRDKYARLHAIFGKFLEDIEPILKRLKARGRKR